MRRDVPLAVHLTDSMVEGVPGLRVAAILASPGCTWARSTGGCTFCGFLDLSTRGETVTVEDYRQQAEAVAEAVGDRRIAELDIYNSGSFLADSEVPEEARLAILRRLASLPGLKRVLVEARPADVTGEKLAALASLAPGIVLEVGIGLETSDDVLRQGAMHKGFSFEAFERAARAVHGSGAALLAYVLVKPPGLSEAAAFRDTATTIRELAALRERLSTPGSRFAVRAALQPAFVARGTALEKEHEAGRYRVLNLWTVVDLVLATHSMLPLQVALWDEGLAEGRVPAGCPECTGLIREALERFNATGDVVGLRRLGCACRPPPM